MIAPKPTPVAQVNFNSCNLKPAPAAKLLVFSDFFIRFGFPESVFRFLRLKSTPRGTKSTLVFKSRLKVRSVRQLKSTLVFKSHLEVCFALHKVDFGFKVASKARSTGI
jgi:hypothetical protein